MSDRNAKLERKEARRVLGDRTTSIVGAIREHQAEQDVRLADAIKALGHAEQRLLAVEALLATLLKEKRTT